MPTAPKENSQHVLGALHIFKPDFLDSEEAIATAISVFQENVDEENAGPLVEHCLQTGLHLVLEFILSAVDSATFQLFYKSIFQSFPNGLTDHSLNSVPFQLLSRLSLSLWAADFPRDGYLADVDNWRGDVEKAPPVLKELVALLRDPDFLGDDTRDTGSSRRQSVSRPRRQSKVLARSEIVVDVQPFRIMGVQVPAIRSTAEGLVSTIFARQRAILEDILSVLRQPTLTSKFQQMYIAANMSPEGEVEVSENLDSVPPSPITARVQEPPVGLTRSLKADMYFDAPEDFGNWHLYMRRDARRYLIKEKNQDARYFKILTNKLRELSQGRFSPTNHKKISNSSPVDIFEARLPGDLRIVYQVDWIQEAGMTAPNQGMLYYIGFYNVLSKAIHILTIFGFYDHSDVRRKNWDYIGRQTAAQKDSEYCRNCSQRDHRPGDGDDVFDPVTGSPHSFDSDNPDATDLRTEDGEMDDADVPLMTEKYALMSQDVWNSILMGKDFSHVFRTSPEEQRIVDYAQSCYVLGRSGTGKTTTIVLKMFGIEKSWSDLEGRGIHTQHPRQMFVTKSRRLAEKVEGEFVGHLESLAVRPHVPQHIIDRIQNWKVRGDSTSWLNNEDTEVWRHDLPRKFSELKDTHFPLFITMDTLFAMLEADFSEKLCLTRQTGRFTWRNGAPQSTGQVITYDVFLDRYWPHLVQNKLSPSVVFSDIIGVIKGSEPTLSSPNHVLDKDTYERKRNIYADYAMFEAYTRRKTKHGDRDAADRTHSVLKAIKSMGVPGIEVSHIYVDEVQDNLLIELGLLRTLCGSPHGLFWAGDTAQTIAAGSAFRFEELKAFIYRFEQANSTTVRRSQQDRKPMQFQLLTNYRSQGGIVRCAHSLIEMLRLFPRAIDKLEREKGVISGAKPMFLDDSDTYAGGFFAALEHSSLELGSNQCILVRDNDARVYLKNVFKRLHASSPVLTVEQSKGLEFDDVIVYHFFEHSSTQKSQWYDLVQAATGGGWKAIGRDSRSYAALVTELKHLYVAFTRAKRRLWIVDCSMSCKPLKDHWLAQGVVQLPNGEEGISDFAVPSKPEDWQTGAQAYFNQGQFDEAADAFERARDFKRATIARAYLRRQEARTIPSASGRQRRLAYLEVAHAFLECGAEADDEDTGRKCYANAGDCFTVVEYNKEAAEAYHQAAEYTKAASHYFKAEMLDESVAVIKQHPEDIKSEVKSEVVNAARYSYLESNKLGQAKELFDDRYQREEFVLEYDFGAAHASILESENEVVEAAELHMREGRVLEGIRLFLQDVTSTTRAESGMKAKNALLQLLWQQTSFGRRSWTDDSKSALRESLVLFERISDDLVTDDDRLTVRMIKSIVLSDTSRIKTLVASQLDNDAVAVMCLDRLFDDWSVLDMDTENGVLASLALFNRYVHLMHGVVMDKAPWKSELVRKIFNIQEAGEDSITLVSGTYLYRQHPWARDTSPLGVLVSYSALTETLRHTLSQRLQSRIREADGICTDISFFDPCLKMLCRKECRSQHQTKVAHQLDSSWFNRRVRFCLQQIILLHCLYMLPDSDEFPARIKKIRTSLSHLESVLDPLLYLGGSMSSLRIDLIPEASEAFAVMKLWIEEVLYTQAPDRPELYHGMLTNVLTATTLGRRLNGATVNINLHRIPCMKAPPWKIRRGLAPLITMETGRPTYAMYRLVNFLDSPSNLREGISFLDYIVKQHIPVELGILCRYIERLSAVFIVTTMRQSKGSVHALTLPQSWILDFWNHDADVLLPTAGAQPKSAPLPVAFLGRPIEALLLHIDKGHMDYLVKNSDISKPWVVNARDMSIARICRCLCFIGLNFNENGTRSSILRVTKSLQNFRAFALGLRLPYVNAQTWQDLDRAVLRSTTSPFDQIVQLYSTLHPITGPPPPDIHRVVFKHVEDISSLLQASAGKPLAIASPEVHTLQSENVEQPMESDIEQQVSIVVTDSKPGFDEAEHDSQHLELTVDHTHQNEDDHAAAGSQEKERAAAIRIQTAARRMLRRLKTSQQDRYVEALARKYWTSAKTWIIEKSHELKASVKRRRAGAFIQDLNGLMEKETTTNRIRRAAVNLQGVLQPKSSFHIRGELPELRAKVREARNLFDGILVAVSSGEF